MIGRRDPSIPIDPEGVNKLLSDLVRVKVAFQLRTIEAVLTEVPPRCRWCHEPVIRSLPCGCARAQEEARRIRAAS